MARFQDLLRSLLLAVTAMAATVLVWATPANAAEAPNIILLMGDDHGWDETGYNAHPHLKTPTLDTMASQGLRLDRFYSAHPSCSPTRGSIITGRHPNRYGTFTPNCSIRPDETGIAHVLRQAGYVSGHFGKWHLGPVKIESPTNPGGMGFDQWLSHDNFFELNPYLSRNGGPPEQFKGEGSEIVVAEAIRFIESRPDKSKPFLAVVWFGSPHEPYSGLEKDLALYTDVAQKYADQETKVTSNKTGLPVTRPLGEVLQERYAEITAMDRAIGQLRDWLDKQGLRDNTLLWYCGDNGTSADGIVTSPFRGAKASLYDGGIRVPGVIEWPARISEPRVSDVNTVTSDILPTLCDLLEIPLPNRPLDGISIKGVLDGEMTQRPSPICFWEFTNQQANAKPYVPTFFQQGTTPLVKLMNGVATRNFRNDQHTQVTDADYGGPRAILDGNYKLLIDAGKDSGKELFDVREDPQEKHNLIESKADVAERLEKQLRTWQESVLNSLTGADYR